MAIFPENFEIPKNASKYLRNFEEGDTIIRILKAPIFGWKVQIFPEKDKDGKTGQPLRTEYWDERAEKQPDPKADFFIGFLVYNVQLKQMQYLELKSKTIQNSILGLEKLKYDLLKTDICINRVGKGMNDTKYTVQAMPPANTCEVPTDILEESNAVDLRKAYINGDPFKDDEASNISEPVKPTEKLVPNFEMPDINIDDIKVNMPF